MSTVYPYARQRNTDTEVMMTYRTSTDERRPRLFGIEPLK